MQTSNAPNLWKRPGLPFDRPANRATLRTYGAEQALFLQRLSDLVDKRQQFEGRLSPDDWHQRLIDKALYSTYLDCLELSVVEEAREILDRGQKRGQEAHAA